MKKRNKIILTILIILLIGISGYLFLKGTKKEEIKEEEKVYVNWEYQILGMNLGEIKVLNWISNKEIDPIVYNEGEAVKILESLSNGIRIKAVESGSDVIVLKYEDYEILCVVNVNEEIFSFDYFEAMMPVGGKEKYFIRAEPEILLSTNNIKYFVENRNVAVIVSEDNMGVEVQGISKGITFIMAEWRGKKTELMVEIFEGVKKEILLSREREYIFVGQETQIKVGLKDYQNGDEEYFKFEKETGKNKIQISSNKNILTIKGIEEGEQFVKISHSMSGKSKNVIIDVLPSGPPPLPYIDVSESPMILRKDESRILKLYMVNGESGKFSYRIIENQYAVEVEQKGNDLLVKGIAPGAAKIRLSNSNVLKEYDVMIIIE
jgi:hypothetical protein